MLSEKSLLLPRDQSSAVNHTETAPVFNDTLQTVWPDGVKQENAFLIITDATPYMKIAIKIRSVSLL
jgi:hypothetical protein